MVSFLRRWAIHQQSSGDTMDADNGTANSREGPTAETSRPLSPDDDHQLLFDQIATATERCELVSRRA